MKLYESPQNEVFTISTRKKKKVEKMLKLHQGQVPLSLFAMISSG